MYDYMIDFDAKGMNKNIRDEVYRMLVKSMSEFKSIKTEVDEYVKNRREKENETLRNE